MESQIRYPEIHAILADAYLIIGLITGLVWSKGDVMWFLVALFGWPGIWLAAIIERVRR
jgi:hypothetical protein